MDAVNIKVALLKEQIIAAEENLVDLKTQLANLEQSSDHLHTVASCTHVHSPQKASSRWPLAEEEYERYGRQMIVPNIGLQGQLRLKQASVLIVGAGGLGCPAAAYLAGAGFGGIGVVDGDVVELSNLHRQILHGTAKLGTKKAISVVEYLKTLNHNVRYTAHTEHLTPQNAASIVQDYNIVLDCTDHPTSRYLISDICVLLRKPLVSASALRTDGQLVVLNYPPTPQGSVAGGPCYRCVFPKPPPAESLTSCGEGGILGTVVGVMGVLQAGEAIKLTASGVLESDPETQNVSRESNVEPSMLLFSANNTPSPFRNIKLRKRRPDCFACSARAELTLESLASGSLDYVSFCGFTSPIQLLRNEERIEAAQYAARKSKHDTDHVLIDVREKVHFDICNIEGSINVPYSDFQRWSRSTEYLASKPFGMPDALDDDKPIYVICRLGNDSQVVTRQLKDMGFDKKGKRFIGDIKDGFQAWKAQVDSSWPAY